MKDTRIYHNPRCRKSRETLALLEQEHIETDVIHYLDEPLSKEELSSLISLLNISPSDLLRKNEAIYKELHTQGKLQSDEDALQAMIDHPTLMQRPIVVHKNQAAIGRPPETVLTLFK